MASESKAHIVHVPESAEVSVVNRLGNPANVWLSGSLKKKGRHWFSRWNEYWFVLYKGVRELRYYKRVVRGVWSGQLVNVPIEEHGAFPMSSIVDIRDVQTGKYGATRFDVIVRTMGDSHYPGEFKDEFERPWFQYKEKVLHLVAPDAKSKELWVDTLRALKQGGGRDATVERMLDMHRTEDDDGVADFFPEDHDVEEEHDDVRRSYQDLSNAVPAATTGSSSRRPPSGGRRGHRAAAPAPPRRRVPTRSR